MIIPCHRPASPQDSDLFPIDEGVAVVAGVRIQSNRSTPGLPTDGRPELSLDVSFGLASALSPLLPEHARPLRSFVELDAWLSDDGRHAWIVEPLPAHFDASSAIRRVLPFASALQGRVVLHASAVALQRDVHAFVGASGAGKSTLARSLGSRGAMTIADDLLPCRDEGGRVVVRLPGHGPDPHGARHLRGVHFLVRSHRLSRAGIRRIAPAQCMRLLLWNGFGELAAPSVWALQFQFYAQISRSVAAYELSVPDDLARLDATAGDVQTLLAALDAADGS